MMQQHAYTAEPAQAALSAAERSSLRALLEHAHCFYAPTGAGEESAFLLVPVTHGILDTLAEFEEHDGREPDVSDYEPDSDTEPNGDERDLDGDEFDGDRLSEDEPLFPAGGDYARNAAACRDAARQLRAIINRGLAAPSKIVALR